MTHTLVTVNGKGIGHGFHQANADYGTYGALGALWKAGEKAQRYRDAGWGAFDTNTFVHTITVTH